MTKELQAHKFTEGWCRQLMTSTQFWMICTVATNNDLATDYKSNL